jgi:DNA replication protein DnaC
MGMGHTLTDKLGADLLFQIISERYERGAILMSTNRAFKSWPEIFNNDTTLTSALLDRLLHHADVCQIEGPSFRAKDHIET